MSKPTSVPRHRRVTVTVGELVAAAYAAAPGQGAARVAATALTLASSALARSLSRPIEVIGAPLLTPRAS